MGTLLRALAHRAGSAATVLAVALVAAAATAAAPVYYSAARASILQDALHSAPLAGRSVAASLSGPVSQIAAFLPRAVRHALGDTRTSFAAPIETMLTSVPAPDQQISVQLAARTAVCAHLSIRGHCPTAADEVVVSTSLAAFTGWRPGREVRLPGWPALRVVGLYVPPGGTADYWFGEASSYFPYEHPSGQRNSAAEDVIFTLPATFQTATAPPQGQVEVDELLVAGRVRPREVRALTATTNGMLNSPSFAAGQIVVQTLIPQTMADVDRSWSSLFTPVVLVTVQLLLVSWLLLFVIVTETIEGRAREVALAKLRGFSPLRAARFGVAEPAAVLAVALPLGTMLAWGGGTLLAAAVLRPGTPVGLPWQAWAAAGFATLGGLAAVIAAAWRTLRRPVLEQWRHTVREGPRRGWILDAVLLSALGATLAEVVLNGQITSARQSALALLVPGLLGAAVAVVASRALPLGCRAAIQLTRRRGGAAWYLALRHVARRADAVRTTMTLVTALALAVFALSSFVVARANYRTLAETAVGAPVVLTVSVPPGQELSAAIAAAGPAGRAASEVDVYYGSAGSGTETLLAVDPARFARVALWPQRVNHTPLGPLLSRIAPSAPPPVVLNGSSLQVSLSVGRLAPAGSDFGVEVSVPSGFGRTPVDLGPLPARGSVTREAALPACPCVLDDFYLAAPPGATGSPLDAQLTLHRLATVQGETSSPVDARLHRSSAWRAGGVSASQQIAVTGGGLSWRVHSLTGGLVNLDSADQPDPMPAVVAAGVTGGRTGGFTGVGLDGRPLGMTAVAAPTALPGAPGNGVIVDRKYALLAAGGNLDQAEQQVWVSRAAAPAVERSLRSAGITVTARATVTAVAAALNRQGPGLATALFLGDALVAAALAAGAVVLGLYSAAARRRYELAALEIAGLSWGRLWQGLLAEELVVLSFGAVVGTVAGLGAAVICLRNVPEFVTTPAGAVLAAAPSGLGAATLGPLLSFHPHAGWVLAFGGAALLLLGVAGTLATLMLVRGVRLSQLREAAP